MTQDHAATVDDAHHGGHPDSYYIKIWAILLVLLLISVAGPMLENPVITLITAFGVAVVKAVIVCAFFMHLYTEKRYVTYLLLVALFIMAMMFSGMAPDVTHMEGNNWFHVNNVRLPPAVHHHGEGEHHGAETQHAAHGQDTHHKDMHQDTHKKDIKHGNAHLTTAHQQHKDPAQSHPEPTATNKHPEATPPAHH